MKKLLLYCFMLFAAASPAQNDAIDSLLQALKNYDAKKLEMNKNILPGEEDTVRVNILNDLSKKYWQISDYTNAKKYADEALVIARQINFKRGIAVAYNNIGIIYYYQGNYTEALKNYSVALKIREELGDKKGIANCYNNIGTVHYDQGNYPEALKNHMASLKIKVEIGDKKGIAGCYNNLGNVYSDLGNYPEALKNYFASLKIKEEFGDKEGIAASYNNIGFIYFSLGNYPEALKNHSAALIIREELGDKYGIAQSFGNIGSVHQDQGNYPEALKNDYAALRIFEEIGDKKDVAITRNNIGTVYSDQGNYPEAMKNHLYALKIRQELADKGGIARSYINIGKTKVEMHNSAEGKEWLIKGLKLAREIGYKEILTYGYQDLAQADSALGNFRGAFENHKLHILYRDSLNNEEAAKKTTQTKMQYEFEKKEAETKAVTDAELKKQKLLRNGFVGGFVVVLLFAGMFLHLQNKTRKAKRRAEEEARRAEEEKKRSDELLLNILPAEVASELKTSGSSKAKAFTMVTVMFTDFVDFTRVSDKISAELLVDEIHHCFSAFDNILQKYKIEKIKTIGDAYLCASGLPLSNLTHAENMILAAFEIRDFMLKRKEKAPFGSLGAFELRLGIHTGPVVAGIVGVKKYAYDIWGDTVNIAARMEQNSEAGKINISGSTYKLVQDKFIFTYRGMIEAKNKGKVEMYFVERSG